MIVQMKKKKSNYFSRRDKKLSHLIVNIHDRNEFLFIYHTQEKPVNPSPVNYISTLLIETFIKKVQIMTH